MKGSNYSAAQTSAENNEHNKNEGIGGREPVLSLATLPVLPLDVSKQHAFLTSRDVGAGALANTELQNENPGNTAHRRPAMNRMVAKVAGMFLGGIGGDALINSRANAEAPTPTPVVKTVDGTKVAVDSIPNSQLGTRPYISEVGSITLVGNEEIGNLRVKVIRVDFIEQLDGKTVSTVLPMPIISLYKNPTPMPNESDFVYGIRPAMNADGEIDTTNLVVTFKVFLGSAGLRDWAKEVASEFAKNDPAVNREGQFPLKGLNLFSLPLEGPPYFGEGEATAIDGRDLDTVDIAMRFSKQDYETFKYLSGLGPAQVGFKPVYTYDGFQTQTVEINSKGVQELKEVAYAELNSQGKNIDGDSAHYLTQADITKAIQKLMVKLKHQITAIGGPEAAQIAIAEARDRLEALLLNFLKSNTLSGEKARAFTSQPEVRAQLASHAHALKLQTTESKDTSQQERDANAAETSQRKSEAHSETKGEHGGGNFFGLVGGGDSHETTDLSASEDFQRKLSEFEKITGVKTHYDKTKQMYVPSEIKVFQLTDASSLQEVESSSSITLAITVQRNPIVGPFVPLGFTQDIVQENIRRHVALPRLLQEIDTLKKELSELYDRASKRAFEVTLPELLNPTFSPRADMVDTTKLSERLEKPVLSSADYYAFDYLTDVLKQARNDKKQLEVLGNPKSNLYPERLVAIFDSWKRSIENGVARKDLVEEVGTSEYRIEEKADFEENLQNLHWDENADLYEVSVDKTREVYSYEDVLNHVNYAYVDDRRSEPPLPSKLLGVRGDPLAWIQSARDLSLAIGGNEEVVTADEKLRIRSFLDDGTRWRASIKHLELAMLNLEYLAFDLGQIGSTRITKEEPCPADPTKKGNFTVWAGPEFLRRSIGEYFVNNMDNPKAILALGDRNSPPWRTSELELMHRPEFWRFVEGDILASATIACITGQGSDPIPPGYSEMLFRLAEIRKLKGCSPEAVSQDLVEAARPIARKVVDSIYSIFMRNEWQSIERDCKSGHAPVFSMYVDLDPIKGLCGFDGREGRFPRWLRHEYFAGDKWEAHLSAPAGRAADFEWEHDYMISRLRQMYFPLVDWERFPWDRMQTKKDFELAFRGFCDVARKVGVNVEEVTNGL